MNRLMFRSNLIRALRWPSLLGCLFLLAACGLVAEEAAPDNGPQPTVAATATVPIRPERDFVVIATDAPFPPFSDFDQFGNVIGFNNSMMENIAARAGFDYEFVVTPHEGVLAGIAAGSARDFDAVMSALVAPEEPEPGIAYTLPYLEVGQVLLVLVDEQEITTAADLRPGMAVGVLAESSGLETARELGIAEADLYSNFERPTQLIQALIDEGIDAAIVDSHIGEFFAATFPEQLKIAGGNGREAWLSSRAYSIAVAADDATLLDRLNQAIEQLRQEGVTDRLSVAWLLPEENPAAAINPGESRVGTAADEIYIGVIGRFTDMDPASLTTDFISWEIKQNVMSGLYRFNSDNELEPLLASDFPTISEDKLEYTIPLRGGLLFGDGSDFSAEDVRWSLLRASRLGHFLVNGYLKDANDDNFADEDAVQVLDPLTVKIILQQPTGYFPAILATPPYAPISSSCFAETSDPGSVCGGIGPYTIVSWEPNSRLRLKANPQWPGRPAPAFENILVRFYADSGSLRRSLTEFESIDLAWTGLSPAEFNELSGLDRDGNGEPDFIALTGPSTFKSYIIFEQQTPPWDKEKVRQAAALALDRGALARDVFGGDRLPLLSPVPNDIPGHLETLPPRDLERARALLLEEGYSASEPLPITLWYVNDGRYSAVEDAYANAIKAQLEETGVFQVEVAGAAWDEFRLQISQCNYPAYILGWPSPGQPTSYLDASAWTDFFVQNTGQVFCSNYESEAMTELVAGAREEVETAARLSIYGEIQALWAEELPTLDLTQEPRRALALPGVDNVRANALGLMHYELLTKEE